MLLCSFDYTANVLQALRPTILAAEELGLGLGALGGLAEIVVDLVVVGAAQAEPFGVAHHSIAVLVVFHVRRGLLAKLAHDPQLVLVRDLALLLHVSLFGVLTADLLLLGLGDQACLEECFL